MATPNYKFISILENDLFNFEIILKNDTNQNHPIVFDIIEMDTENQRKALGNLEDFYLKQKKSSRFPYPVYVLSTLKKNNSEFFSIINSSKELPTFFLSKNSKFSESEKTMLKKNKILQQEIINNCTQEIEKNLKLFSKSHRQISLLEAERIFYLQILNSLKGNRDD